MPWLDNKKVDALWANNQKSNVHAWIDGSWKKLDDDHDDACTNMAILAAHAKNDNRNVKVFVNGTRVEEMYVW